MPVLNGLLLASYGPSWTLLYVLQMQVVPCLAELALDLCMEGSLQLLNGYRQFLAATLAVELPSAILFALHTGRK